MYISTWQIIGGCQSVPLYIVEFFEQFIKIITHQRSLSGRASGEGVVELSSK